MTGRDSRLWFNTNMMTTISELAHSIAEATGCGAKLVGLVLDDLAEHDLIAGPDAPANAEDAAKLIVAYGGAASISTAHRSIQRFWNLPFDRMTWTEASGRWGESRADGLTDAGGTFGEFITNLLESYITAPAVSLVPVGLFLNSGPGTTEARASFTWLQTNVELDVTFCFTNLEGGLPDDAPRARREIEMQFPGEIFQVVREALTGNAEYPEIVIASEEFIEACQQGEM